MRRCSLIVEAETPALAETARSKNESLRDRLG